MNIVKARNLTKSFDGKKVLEDINLEIKKGEVIGIIGPSGSGKTTLSRVLNLLEPYDRGNLLLFGFDVNSLNGNSLKLQRRMSMVFQKPIIFNSSVYHNVGYGLKVRTMREGIMNKKFNTTIIITSHDISHINRLCNRIYHLNNGKLK